MKRRLMLAAALSIGVVALAAFLLGQSLSSPVASADHIPMVRVVHAVADAPAVDILVDGTPAFTGVEFEDVTDYASLTAGTYTVTVVPTGSTTPVLTESLTLTEYNDYTVVAYGTLADDSNPLQLLVAMDDNMVPPVGQTRARFFHLVPTVPPVDVAVQDGPTLVSDVAYGEVSSYVEVNAGTYDLELQVQGTTLTVPVNDVMVDPNTVYSFFAVPSGGEVNIIASVDAQYARVRAFHAIPDAPAVDVLVNGSPAFTDVAYKDLTDYAAVMSGTYTVAIAPAGTTTPVLTQTLVVTGGMDFTVAAAGTLTDTDMIAPQLVPYADDNSAPPDDQAKVRFIHLAPGAPAVDVGVAGVTTPLFPNVAYLEATDYELVDSGTYTLTASLAEPPGTQILLVEDVRFSGGTIYTAFAVGLVDDQPPVEVVLKPEPFKLYLPLVLNNFAAGGE